MVGDQVERFNRQPDIHNKTATLPTIGKGDINNVKCASFPFIIYLGALSFFKTICGENFCLFT